MLPVYRNRASVEEPSRLRAHPKALRLTLLAVFCSMQAQEITDGLVELGEDVTQVAPGDSIGFLSYASLIN